MFVWGLFVQAWRDQSVPSGATPSLQLHFVLRCPGEAAVTRRTRCSGCLSLMRMSYYPLPTPLGFLAPPFDFPQHADPKSVSRSHWGEKNRSTNQTEGEKWPVMSRMESATRAPAPFGSSLEADGFHVPSSSAVSCALQGGASFRRECVNKHICHFFSKQIALQALIIRQGSSDCFIMQMRRRRQRASARLLGALLFLLSLFFLLSV